MSACNLLLYFPITPESALFLLPLRSVVLYERITTWLSVAAFLYVLKIFRYLQLNASMYLLWHTIALAQFDLGTFLLMFTLVLIGYTVWGTLAFGFGSEGFSSLGASFWSCLDMLQVSSY